MINDQGTLLIIDDNPQNIQLAANVLKTTHLYHIFFATDGMSGLKLMQKHNIDLVLLDINMPGMNGFEVADKIRQTNSDCDIPIIFLSAYSDQASVNQAFEHGGQDYVTKPFKYQELLHRVSTHLALYKSRKKLQERAIHSQTLLVQYKDAIDVSSLVSKTDRDGIITYVNDAFCEISMYEREELIGQPHNIVRHPNMSSNTFKEMWETISSKQSWSGVVQNRRKDGGDYFVSANVIPILDENDNIIEFISIRHDITKEMRAKEEIAASQREILVTLGELGEMRSQETGDHVNRVARISALLAKAYGLEKRDVELLKIASPMHDIGKIAIPDAILLKPARLDASEFEVMKTHAGVGYEVFKKSKHELLQLAATIAHEHHEKWDGTGYPRGLKAEEISIYGRITAIVDVFDALSQKRIYKEAWAIEDVLNYIKNESGKAFEPRLVELLLENLDAILEIKETYTR